MSTEKIKLVDGDTVIVTRDRLNITMNIDDVYKYRFNDSPDKVHKSPIDPGSPKGKYFPIENDMVYSWELGMYRVAAADPTTYVVDLAKWLYRDGDAVPDGDILSGISPGTGGDSWRLFLDTSVFPYRCDLDTRFLIPGSEPRYVVFFQGTNTSHTGEILSAYYDHTGTYVSEKIPLEMVAMTKLENTSLRRAKMGYCRRELDDGEVVTVVTYNLHNNVCGIDRFIVHRTNVTRKPEIGDRRISSVELVSPYISKTQPDLLEIPINATISTLAMRGRVNYTDGTHRVLDVGDEDSAAPFRILGLKYWSPAQVGPIQGITLAYRVDHTSEYSYLQGETQNGTVVVPYRIKSMPVDPSFSLKLFAFPVWNDPINGWTLDYWLYSLDRDISHRVIPSAVELVSGSPAFDPLDYIRVQTLGLAVDLKKVSQDYGGHRHVQNVQVALLADGGQASNRWKVRTTANQGGWYGERLFAEYNAVGGGLYDLDISNGHVDFKEWLNDVYVAVNPLVNPVAEVRAPEPTHMLLVSMTRTIEVPITQWRTAIKLPSDLRQGQNLYIRWIKRLANTDLQLGVSALTVRMV